MYVDRDSLYMYLLPAAKEGLGLQGPKPSLAARTGRVRLYWQ